jgi:hypothetical protein
MPMREGLYLTFQEFGEAFAKALDAQNGGRIRNLSPSSRVCQDGGVAGDDFPELLERISAIYGTDFTDIPPFGGSEADFGPYGLFQYLRRWWRCESESDVSVGELYEAVKAGSWREAFPNSVRQAMPPT